ncbi:MAG: peptidylprolyl isomerase [Micavibrio sp.]|nr:peptidylprolyl isomerase [Micavibrio sp.]
MADKENLAYLELKDGKVTIELRPDLAPKHVARIKELIGEGYYDGLKFHRVIPGFMAQTGCPEGTGYGGSGKKLPAEFTDTPFKRGTLGMARAMDPNSGDTQFFITFGETPHLDGDYTVWGQVIENVDLIDNIAKGEPPRTPDKIVKFSLA